MYKRAGFLVLPALLALTLSACGGSDDGAAAVSLPPTSSVAAAIGATTTTLINSLTLPDQSAPTATSLPDPLASATSQVNAQTTAVLATDAAPLATNAVTAATAGEIIARPVEITLTIAPVEGFLVANGFAAEDARKFSEGLCTNDHRQEALETVVRLLNNPEKAARFFDSVRIQCLTESATSG